MVDPSSPNGSSIGIPYATSISNCPKCGVWHFKADQCLPQAPLYTFNQQIDCAPLLWAELVKLNAALDKLHTLLASWQGDGK